MSQIIKFLEDHDSYVNDIWRRIYYISIFFALVFLSSFFSSGLIIQKFIDAFHLENVMIAVTSPFQLFDLGIDVSMFIATVLTIPVIIWNVYSFFRPALSDTEFTVLRSMLYLIPSSLFLFAAGFLYGFFGLYIGLGTLAQFYTSLGLDNIWDIGLFWSQLFSTATMLGTIFQFPIIIKLLINFGVVSRQFLIEKRRVAYAIIIIGVSCLPPTDGISLIIMSLPLWAMYELTVFLSRPIQVNNYCVEGESISEEAVA